MPEAALPPPATHANFATRAQSASDNSTERRRPPPRGDRHNSPGVAASLSIQALQHQWIDANRYIAHFQSALRPGYTYDNPALQLFVTWPPNVRASAARRRRRRRRRSPPLI